MVFCHVMWNDRDGVFVSIFMWDERWVGAWGWLGVGLRWGWFEVRLIDFLLYTTNDFGVIVDDSGHNVQVILADQEPLKILKTEYILEDL